MQQFELKLEAVLPETLAVLGALMRHKTFTGYRLVGGTALALYRGHRMSMDIDLFVEQKSQDLIRIRRTLDELGTVEQFSSDNDGAAIGAFINGVKVDVVAYPYPWIEEAISAKGFSIASPLDIGAMKIAAVGQRGTKKDFYDLYELLQLFSLEKLLEAFSAKYRLSNDLHYVQALTYFDDAEKSLEPKLLTLPSWDVVKERIVSEVRRVCLLPTST